MKLISVHIAKNGKAESVQLNATAKSRYASSCPGGAHTLDAKKTKRKTPGTFVTSNIQSTNGRDFRKRSIVDLSTNRAYRDNGPVPFVASFQPFVLVQFDQRSYEGEVIWQRKPRQQHARCAAPYPRNGRWPQSTRLWKHAARSSYCDRGVMRETGSRGVIHRHPERTAFPLTGAPVRTASGYRAPVASFDI